MITLGGATYSRCGHCLNRFAVECMGWDNELLTWVCYPDSVPPGSFSILSLVS